MNTSTPIRPGSRLAPIGVCLAHHLFGGSVLAQQGSAGIVDEMQFREALTIGPASE